MRYVLILLALLFTNVANAMDCEKVPDCESLGYSNQNDPNCSDDGYMYCPFNHDYKKCVQYDCAKLGFTESDKTFWCAEIVNCKGNPKYTACNCLKPRCDIGDVFYADGSCGDVKDYTEDKVPVGVVYDTNCAGGGKVINLHNLGRIAKTLDFDPENPYSKALGSFHWGYYAYDVPGLTNYGAELVDKLKAYDPDLYDGQGNTATILAAKAPDCDKQKDTNDYYIYCVPHAARAAHAFYPPNVDKQNSIVGQGKWYLPAVGELMDLYGYDNSLITANDGISGATGKTKTLVNNTLRALKDKNVQAEELTEAYYWSSTELKEQISWLIHISTGDRHPAQRKDFNFVRASLAF